MSELVEFLRERLAEDEQTARGACQGPWIVREWGEPAQFAVFSQRDSRGGVEHVCDTELHAIKWRENRDHIARHDPARVLREVEAKRQRIEHYLEVRRLADPVADKHQAYVLAEGAVGMSLRFDALPYAEHDDYREEWKP